MKTGKIAGVLVAGTSYALVHAFPQGESGVITITLVSEDASAVNVQVRHVTHGATGTQADAILPLTALTNLPVHIVNLGVTGKDEVWVKPSITNKVTVSINTTGLEYRRGGQ